jgi:Zn-dependent protease with chaperone function
MDFAGSVFRPDAADRTAAVLTLGRMTLRVALPDGTLWELAWRDLRLTQGGNDHRMTFLTHADGRIICSDAEGFLAAVAEMAPQEHAAAARQHLGGRRLIATGRASFWLALVAGCLALLVGAWLAIPWAAARAVNSMPTSVDREIGDSSYEQMDLGGTKLTQPEIDAALTTIITRLSPQAKLPLDFRCQVVQSDQVNAFCLPGGRIVVYTGLLKKATRPEQVAGVLAHEIAHATLRHGLQGMAKQLGVVIGVQVLTGDVSGLSGQIATAALTNGYSRDMEREADAEGLRMLAAAGIDPHGMAEFFALMDASGIPAWLSTHPDNAERIATIKAAIPQLTGPAITPLAIDWSAIQAALPR